MHSMWVQATEVYRPCDHPSCSEVALVDICIILGIIWIESLLIEKSGMFKIGIVYLSSQLVVANKRGKSKHKSVAVR